MDSYEKSFCVEEDELILREKVGFIFYKTVGCYTIKKYAVLCDGILSFKTRIFSDDIEIENMSNIENHKIRKIIEDKNNLLIKKKYDDFTMNLIRLLLKIDSLYDSLDYFRQMLIKESSNDIQGTKFDELTCEFVEKSIENMDRKNEKDAERFLLEFIASRMLVFPEKAYVLEDNKIKVKINENLEFTFGDIGFYGYHISPVTLDISGKYMKEESTYWLHAFRAEHIKEEKNDNKHKYILYPYFDSDERDEMILLYSTGIDSMAKRQRTISYMRRNLDMEINCLSRQVKDYEIYYAKLK